MVGIKKEILLRTSFLICIAFLLLTISSPLSSATVTTSVYPQDMPIPPPAGNCDRCHDFAKHPMNNCNSCHDLAKYEPQASILAGGHGGLTVSDEGKAISTAPVGNCLVCHTYTNECQACHPSFFGGATELIPDPNPRWPSNYTHDTTRIKRNYVGVNDTYECEMCHVQNRWSTIPQHDSTAFGSVYDHQGSIDSRCGECHDAALTREHYRRTDPATGNPLDCFTCHSSVNLQVQQAIAANNRQCSACHTQGHNLNIVSDLPGDVLLYPGLKWTAPLPLSLWQGEPWIEGDTAGFRMVMSNRSNLSSDGVWAFYRDGMTARGWSVQSPEPVPGSPAFKATFVKGSARIIVWFYGSEDRSGQGTVSSGSRIEIIFKG